MTGNGTSSPLDVLADRAAFVKQRDAFLTKDYVKKAIDADPDLRRRVDQAMLLTGESSDPRLDPLTLLGIDPASPEEGAAPPNHLLFILRPVLPRHKTANLSIDLGEASRMHDHRIDDHVLWHCISLWGCQGCWGPCN